MEFLRYAPLVLLIAFCSSLHAADPRKKALDNASAHLRLPTEDLLAAVYFVVIGYEGNLPLFQKAIVPPPKNGTGLAIPIDSRGYFLTAAHSIAVNRDMYVMGRFDGQLRVLKAEIVFRGDPSRIESDYSVLKVQAAIPRCLAFADVLPREGEIVYAVVRVESQCALAEGVCCAIPNEYGANGSLALKSDIPVIGGDSGGPLLTGNLKLLGIASRTIRVWGFHRTYACCPSQKLIMDVVDHHSAKRSNQPPLQTPASGTPAASAPGAADR